MAFFGIRGGGGGDYVVIKDSVEPTSAVGKNGNMYLKYIAVLSDLEYISNASANGFVPIGVKGKKNTKFVVKCNIHGGGNFATPIGARLSVSSSNMLIFFKYNGGNTAKYAVNSGDTAFGNISNFYDKPITITLSNDIVRIEDENGNYVEAMPSNTSDFLTEQMMLFNLGVSASGIYGADTACYMDLYECKVYENDELQKYLLPKTDNNVIGLVDAMNGDFYASSGNITGTARTELLTKKVVNSAYVKVDGVWQKLYGTDIDKIGVVKPFPYGYTLLDYIKSDGSAWINTQLRFTTDTKFEIKGRWTTTSLSSEFFFGIWQSLKESELGYESGSLVYLMGGTGKYQSFTPDTNSHVISSDANGIYVDGVSVGTPTWANVSTGYDIPIFARSVTGTIRSNEITSHFELEYCKIWQNDALVRDFVPCINDDTSVIGLYDKANDVFYTNAGSGSFIAGDPI